MPRVFLITGTSSGFGQELVKVVLEKGDIAVATARNPKKLSFEGALIAYNIAIGRCRGLLTIDQSQALQKRTTLLYHWMSQTSRQCTPLFQKQSTHLAASMSLSTMRVFGMLNFPSTESNCFAVATVSLASLRAWPMTKSANKWK